MRKQKNQAANSVEASSSICRRLKKAIADSGLTCYSIAKDAGVAPSVVYRWVKGQRSISLETADRLAGSLRLRPEREAPSVAVIPEEERSVTAMVSNGKHSPSTPTGNVKPNIGIGPYSPGMTATGSDTEELGARCMRLQAVFAYALALAKASVKSWDCDLKCNVHNLDDHEGDLTVTWNVEPTNAERRFFEVAWADGSVGDGGGSIHHQVRFPFDDPRIGVALEEMTRFALEVCEDQKEDQEIVSDPSVAASLARHLLAAISLINELRDRRPFRFLWRISGDYMTDGGGGETCVYAITNDSACPPDIHRTMKELRPGRTWAMVEKIELLGGIPDSWEEGNGIAADLDDYIRDMVRK
jgi:hypothetical protein